MAWIVERYSAPHRAYHGLEHLLECLHWLAVSEEHAERVAEVRLAIVYHDAVYAPGGTDDEQRSAALFRAFGAIVAANRIQWRAQLIRRRGELRNPEG